MQPGSLKPGVLVQGQFGDAVDDRMKGKTGAQVDGIAPKATKPAASKPATAASQPVRKPQPLLPRPPSGLFEGLPAVSKA